MIERVALHQTRLHTPGVGLDGRGIALGTKGLVLLPSVDRLVMLLAAYTRERSLQDMLPALAIYVARSKMGTREIVLEIAAESSDHMDHMAERARLVGGFAFTGTSRHFVQYRDAQAPFGYDAKELLSTDAAIAVYHERFSQTYDVERRIDLRTLMVRLMLRVDPTTRIEEGPRIVVAEGGLGEALVRHFVRSNVEGEVCVAEWPPRSAIERVPLDRWVFCVPDLPERLRRLATTTPGITCFVPAGPGVAVEAGYKHPVELRACPAFDAAGLVLLRGRGDEPWIVDRLPVMGALDTLARVEMRPGGATGARAVRTSTPQAVRVPLRILSSNAPWRKVTATWVPIGHLPLLRRLAYALPHATLAQADIAVTAEGAFIRSKSGIETIPLGTFFVEARPRLYVAAGYRVAPAVSPEVLERALGAPASHVLFVGTDGRTLAVDEGAFVALETALLEAPPWEPATAAIVERALVETPIDLKAAPLGVMPTLGMGPPPEGP